MFTVLFYRIEVSTGSISQNAVCKLCFSPVHISVRSWFHTVFIQTHVACGCLLAWVLLRTLLHCFFFFFLWCFKYIDLNCIFRGAAEVLYQWMEESGIVLGCCTSFSALEMLSPQMHVQHSLEPSFVRLLEVGLTWARPKQWCLQHALQWCWQM